MLWLIKFVLSEIISVKTRTYVRGKNYAIVLSPNIFELAPLWQYFAHVGIHCSYSFLTALALVDVLGVFTSEIGFRTPKIQRSDVL